MMDISKTLMVGSSQFQISPFISKYYNEKTPLGIYAGRSYAINWGEDPEIAYGVLRRKSVLFDVPERPVEIVGPDALILLEKVLSRSISNLKKGKARYAIACLENGGILMDGIVMCLAEDRYWYVKADGEFDTWLKAHSIGLNVEIKDPQSWVLQIQGPTSLAVMNAVTNGAINEAFGYFNVGWFEIGGQKLLISRTGWTGELGYEVYTQGEQTDACQLWDVILDAGKPFGLIASSLDTMNIRRIEAGICNNKTDIDETMTPFQAGLGAFVDFGKQEFIGRNALMDANRDCLLFGFKILDLQSVSNLGSDLIGLRVCLDEKPVGWVTVSAYSPYLKAIIGYVRFYEGSDWVGKKVKIVKEGFEIYDAQVSKLPLYDSEKRIPRGLDQELPEF